MMKTFPSLPQWTFDISETSYGVYEVIGRNQAGHIVSAKGTDSCQLLDECKCAAEALAAKHLS